MVARPYTLLLLVADMAFIATAHAAQPAVLPGDACQDFSVATAAPNGSTARLSYPGHASDTPSDAADAAVPPLVLLAMQPGVVFHLALWNADSISVFLDGLDEEDEQMQQQQQQLPQQQQQQQHLQQQQPIGVTQSRRKPDSPGTGPLPHYIFCSNTTSNATAERTARALQQRMAAALAARGVRPDEALYRLRRLHFVLPPCRYVSLQLLLLLDSWPALPGVNTVLKVGHELGTDTTQPATSTMNDTTNTAADASGLPAWPVQPASRPQHALPVLQVSRLDCRAYWCYPGIPDGSNGTLVYVPSLCHAFRSSLEAQATGEPAADQDELDKDVQDRAGRARGDEAADGLSTGRDVFPSQELNCSRARTQLTGAEEEEDTSRWADLAKASRLDLSSVGLEGRQGGHGFVADIPAGSYLLIANSSRAGSPGCSYLVMLRHAQAASAAGIIVIADPGRSPELIGPSNAAEEAEGAPPGMQATMISHGSGQRLLKQLLESRGEGCAAEEAGGRCRLQGGSRRVLWGPQQQRQAVRSQQQRQQQWQQQQQQAVQQVERRADDALGLADLVDSQVDQDRKAEPLLAMTFRTFEKGSGLMLGVDGRRRFVEGGRMAFPFLRHLLWQGQHMQYRDRLQGRLQPPPEPKNSNSFEVSLFEREPMTPSAAFDASAVLPSTQQLRQYSHMELYFALGCPGPFDSSCPYWDHVVQLFVCCDDPQGLLPPCPDCRDTVWTAPTPRSHGFRASWPGVGAPRVDRQPGRSSPEAGSVDSRQGTEGSRVGGFQATRRPIKVDQRATAPRLLTESGGGGRGGRGGGGGAGSSTKGIGRSGLAGSSSNRSSSAGDSSNRGGSARSTSGAACGFELGRWVTPFRRGSGEWLTDVTPLLPLLPTNRCRFTVQVPAWAPGWLATARLRFSAPPPSPQATPDPQALQPSIASTPVTSMATSAADVSERHPASLAVATSSTTISTQVLNQATEVPLSTAGPGTVNGTAINSKVLSQETEVLEVPLSLTGSRTAGGGDRVAGLRFQEGGSPSDCQQGEDVIQQPGRQQQEQLSMPEAQQQQKPLQLPRPHTRNLRPVPPASRHQLPTGMDNREPRLSLTHSWCQSACIQKCGTLPQGEGCDLVPFFTIPLWNGGRFDAGYNARQQELQVELPFDCCQVAAAQLVVIISGHGEDANANCAEFCPTSHHFSFNGAQEHVMEFTAGGTQWGCAEQVALGGLPNEYGTWFLGRNGWCNGRDVVPLVWDVGSELQYGLGRYNVLQYRSLQGGLQYNVTDTPAEMLVASYLTLFAQRQSVAPAS